ncbi:unnamed protein product [Cyprideis torosa]|uniref:Anoctamin dimerisation domain-containing protein n=1 Tax=Cyprideis torosa TaxID=163714 RepID=A0A7R8ZPA1_9CRUS|nr:unnamed protein product [Cyprideis torosa]CAG0889387.1 unnamed protein product [Cyprideis torosa]
MPPDNEVFRAVLFPLKLVYGRIDSQVMSPNNDLKTAMPSLLIIIGPGKPLLHEMMNTPHIGSPVTVFKHLNGTGMVAPSVCRATAEPLGPGGPSPVDPLIRKGSSTKQALFGCVLLSLHLFLHAFQHHLTHLHESPTKKPPFEPRLRILNLLVDDCHMIRCSPVGAVIVDRGCTNPYLLIPLWMLKRCINSKTEGRKSAQKIHFEIQEVISDSDLLLCMIPLTYTSEFVELRSPRAQDLLCLENFQLAMMVVLNQNSPEIFFEDGTTRIDFVLVWKSDDAGLLAHKVTKRTLFEQNLEDDGLLLEYSDNKDLQLRFVKIHAPYNVLLRYAEILKMKMPMKEPYEEEADEPDTEQVIVSRRTM